MANKSEYSFTPASAYAASTNVLPTIRTAVKTKFSGEDWNGREAAILAIDIRSASAFTVKLNRETEVAATNVSGTYVVQYKGVIEYVVFNAQTTVTALWVAWAQQHKDHNAPTITAATGLTAVVTNLDGSSIYTDADGKYELEMGEYTMTVDSASYNFFYNLEDTITA